MGRKGKASDETDKNGEFCQSDTNKIKAILQQAKDKVAAAASKVAPVPDKTPATRARGKTPDPGGKKSSGLSIKAVPMPAKSPTSAVSEVPSSSSPTTPASTPRPVTSHHTPLPATKVDGDVAKHVKSGDGNGKEGEKSTPTTVATTSPADSDQVEAAPTPRKLNLDEGEEWYDSQRDYWGSKGQSWWQHGHGGYYDDYIYWQRWKQNSWYDYQPPWWDPYCVSGADDMRVAFQARFPTKTEFGGSSQELPSPAESLGGASALAAAAKADEHGPTTPAIGEPSSNAHPDGEAPRSEESTRDLGSENRLPEESTREEDLESENRLPEESTREEDLESENRLPESTKEWDLESEEKPTPTVEQETPETSAAEQDTQEELSDARTEAKEPSAPSAPSASAPEAADSATAPQAASSAIAPKAAPSTSAPEARSATAPHPKQNPPAHEAQALETWRCDKYGRPLQPRALYMRFYRNIRSESDKAPPEEMKEKIEEAMKCN